MPSVAPARCWPIARCSRIGVSGDGDTGAIGIGQFVHMMRRNLPMIYIIEDNGCYGLTKGQFSPTADYGSKLKTGVVNDLPPIDICALAVELGASFVARSFSGDKKQLLVDPQGGDRHRGTCMIDVISPCVTFNDHEGSTKSYAYARITRSRWARSASCRSSRTSRSTTSPARPRSEDARRVATVL